MDKAHRQHSLAARRAARFALGALASTALVAAAGAAHAQAVVMAGSYQNFDVLNNTGQPACGFEMEVHGVSSSQLTRIFPSNFNAGVIRYGFGHATDFPGGVYVRWESPYDAQGGRFTACTPVPPSMSSVPGDSCWTIGMPGTYQTAGCEHFGISTYYANPTSIVYRWLVPDPANPGQLMYSDASVSIPAPVWSALPPAQPALPPVVVAEIPAPPPVQPVQFGDAQWVKVYKTEIAGRVQNVDDLVGDNPALVPEDPAEVETSWQLLQADPPLLAGKKRQRGKFANQGNLGNGHHAVVRRYEYYKYAGVYDPVTHEALCADGTCTAPGPGELGDAVGAQNAAANLDVNALTVSVVGGGDVSSSDKVFSCGNKCYGVYAPGATVTLTADANSGNAFTGWSGACAGASPTCTVTLDAESSVTATFATLAAGVGGGGAGGGCGGGGGGVGGGNAAGGGATFTLQVSRSNSGTVVATPDGVDRALNCGATCAAKYIPGTAVTLTATAPLGKSFLGWSGACAGASPQCTVTMNGNLATTAAFGK
jgi:hypothetical protein